MSITLINRYYTKRDKLIQYGGSKNELSIRDAFKDLLNHYAEKKNLMLVPEIAVQGTKGAKVKPDGTLKNALRLDYGYWESKDEKDTIDDEINTKLKKGYPQTNILFEDGSTAVLIQHGDVVDRIDMFDREKLDKILNQFISYEHPQVTEFNDALKKFQEDLPDIVDALRDMMVKQGKENKNYVEARDKFLEHCKQDINPDFTVDDVREMMIQHILTEEIFNAVFDETQFHRENNIARELDKVIDTFFIGDTRRNTLDSIRHYYNVISNAARNIPDHHEKQKFLKVIYENFYKTYNPKAADRLGVVYTPNEIVNFMIESTDYLLQKHFGKTLADKNVEILDPATGTGTFICDIIDYIPKQYLPYKYKNEIHANEVAILPYYVANLNIEYTYKQKMGYYEEFPNLCFVDTLDNTTALKYTGQQTQLFGFSSENTERIKRQNQKKISVIIGNPPYNANQLNENENNKNREYPSIDKRIKDTYIRESTAQKTKLYDMYARFLRWASDRVAENGIVAFVSNNSFINSRTYDGFRKIVAQEFNEIWIIDLKGNATTSGEQRKKEGGNIFSDLIRVGVSVYFLIKNGKDTGCKLFYNAVQDYARAIEKKEYLRANNFKTLTFQKIVPDKKNNWINLVENDFFTLVPAIDKDVKLRRKKEAIFELYSLGVVTARDEWVYDDSTDSLKEKLKFIIQVYNNDVVRLSGKTQKKELRNEVNYSIKWSRAIKNELNRGTRFKLEEKNIIESSYRPFVTKQLYFDRHLNEMQYQLPKVFFGPNKVIAFRCVTAESLVLLSTDKIFDYAYLKIGNGGTFSIPFYKYDESGNAYLNITDWGLEQFVNHYNNKKIKKEDIFHYVYGVLHNPAYRKKYELNLKREFPRIPFYKDFWQWAKWGKQIMDLHINYEEAKPFQLKRIDEKPKEKKEKQKEFFPKVKEPEPMFGIKPKIKVKLKADKQTGAIEIDEITRLKGIPKEAWEYKLGNRSALEWILDQYKEKKPKDKTIAEKFNTYRFADYKEHVIELLKKVTTVSVETMKIIRAMENEK
jgi:predicted helicase